jgi:broad specificity phosphatase PhoE
MASFSSTDWPRRLWIVRHGESSGNVARDAAEGNGLALIDLKSRDADTPLSALGERQGEALAAWFVADGEPPDVFLTSPFLRSRQTIDTIVAACGRNIADVQVDERLREKEFGILDRYTKHGIAAKFPDLAAQRRLVGKFYFRPPGGESWCDVILRLRSVVDELRRDYVGRRVLIVSHQVVVNCFRYLLERMDEREILAIDKESDVPNCGVTEYALKRADGGGERFRLERTNFVVPLLEAGTPVTRAPDRPAGPK